MPGPGANQGWEEGTSVKGFSLLDGDILKAEPQEAIFNRSSTYHMSGGTI